MVSMALAAPSLAERSISLFICSSTKRLRLCTRLSSCLSEPCRAMNAVAVCWSSSSRREASGSCEKARRKFVAWQQLPLELSSMWKRKPSSSVRHTSLAESELSTRVRSGRMQNIVWIHALVYELGMEFSRPASGVLLKRRKLKSSIPSFPSLISCLRYSRGTPSHPLASDLLGVRGALPPSSLRRCREREGSPSCCCPHLMPGFSLYPTKSFCVTWNNGSMLVGARVGPSAIGGQSESGMVSGSGGGKNAVDRSVCSPQPRRPAAGSRSGG